MMARRSTMPFFLSFCLFSFFSVSSALPWPGALPTLAYDAADWTPVPTSSPQPQDANRNFFPRNVCGFVGARGNEPQLCPESSSCVWDSAYSVVGCCPIDAPCTVGIYTGCADRNSPSQAMEDPAILTCGGDAVCYQNSYPAGYRRFACGSSSGLATNVETAFYAQSTSTEVWVVLASFVVRAAPSTASTTTAPSETAHLTTITGEIDSKSTTVVGEVSSGVLFVTSTSVGPAIPTYFPFPNATTSSASETSTSSTAPPAISTSSSSSSSSDISLSQTSSLTGTKTDPLSLLPTVTTSSTSNINIDPTGTLETATVSTASSTSNSTSISTPSTKNKNIIIGTIVGVGGAAILGVAGVVLFCLRRRRQQQQPSQGETALLTPMRPSRTDDSFCIHFDYPDDTYSPTSPAQPKPTFSPPPNPARRVQTPKPLPVFVFPQPPTTIPSQKQRPTRAAAAPLSREETRREMTPLTTTFDNYHPAVREATGVGNSPRKYTLIPPDEEAAWRAGSRKGERARMATQAPRFGVSSNLSGRASPAVALPGPGMSNMF